MPTHRHESDDQKPRKEDAVNPNWRAEVDKTLVALGNAKPEHGDRYYHAMLLTSCDVVPDLHQTPPRVLAQGQRIRHAIPVKLPGGGLLIHIVFDDHPWENSGDDFATYTRALQSMRKILRTIPKGVLPDIRIPTLDDALDESLVAWFSCLHWLAQRPTCLYQSKLEYLESSASLTDDALFKDWLHCPTLADFDPVPILTSTAWGGKTLSQWRADHVECGRPFPGLIAASITKPLWRASQFALHQLLRENTTHKLIKPLRGNRKLPVPPEVKRLHGTLWDHHFPSEGETCFERLTGEQMAFLFHREKTVTSRYLKKLLSMVPDMKLRGMDAYKVLCKTGRIKDVLVQLGIKCNLPDATKHFQVDDMNDFEDPKSPRPDRG